jgi:hypothetical protein
MCQRTDFSRKAHPPRFERATPSLTILMTAYLAIQ